jgi:hypothetical protein
MARSTALPLLLGADARSAAQAHDWLIEGDESGTNGGSALPCSATGSTPELRFLFSPYFFMGNGIAT